jgi:hypothetical protein
MNQGPLWDSLMKKTKVQKSHDTVPLSCVMFFFTLKVLINEASELFKLSKN